MDINPFESAERKAEEFVDDMESEVEDVDPVMREDPMMEEAEEEIEEEDEERVGPFELR